MNFNDFGLDKRIIDALRKKGYKTPSPIQEKAIPPALEGRDILGCAQTGTGKTCAFAAPILHWLGNNPSRNKYGKIRSLILTPTRELAMQIDESFWQYGRYMPFKNGVIMGGVSEEGQIRALSAGLDILTATPGRFLDLASRGYVDPAFVEIFVLDEADRMLDMGFLPDVSSIIEMLPAKRQTLFFSATMPPEVSKLAGKLLTNPVTVAVTPVSSTVDKVEQFVCTTDKANKTDLLVWLMLEGFYMTSVLIFTRTKIGAEKLRRDLGRANIYAEAIHGDKSQTDRQNALRQFKRGVCNVLVATDIAARGLDIDDISHVINFEMPYEAETYVHRIGRTGRMGKSGTAISLCDYDEKPYLADIEKLIKKQITVFEKHPYPMTVFAKTARPRRYRR